MRTLTLFGTAGLGAGLMYILDPDRGRGRRALVRDKATSLLRRSERVAGKKSRDVRNRLHGLTLEAQSLLNGEQLLSSNGSRFLAGCAGAALAAYGAKRRDEWGAVAAVLGAGMLARGLKNIQLARPLGLHPENRAVDVQKTITLNVPVSQVFEFWANHANFPRFMSHLKEVRDTGSGRSHWVAVGPAGVPVEWDAEITQLIPNEVLAWKSIPGSTIENTGVVRFQSNPDGSTELDIRISYNPPAGRIGHSIAKLFGADPEQALSDDLARLKALLELGRTTAHGETITREEMSGIARTLVPNEIG